MMFKRSLIVGLFSLVCLAVFACNDDEHKDSACEELKCDQIVGGKVHVCTVISGTASCKVACLGTAEGPNEAVCYSNSSLPPDARPVFSSVDTCAKDDNGVLYSVSVDEDECKNGCNEENGLCNAENQAGDCSLSCVLDGGDPKVCVKISGAESCKDSCQGEIEGTNAAVCYENASLPPENRDQFSVVTECAKDDLGTLYATSRQATKCDNGCNSTSGECNEESEVTCDSTSGECEEESEATCDSTSGECEEESEATCEELNCEAIVGDGIAHFCATIEGKAVCKNECLGTQEGENAPICFSNGSLPSDARKFYTFVDTCAKDDNDRLYSVSAQMDECTNGCYENGECR